MRKINDIINEELEKVVNQSFGVEPDDLIFKQQIINSGFYHYDKFSGDYDIEINQSNIFVTWHLGFLVNENAVIKFVPKVVKVEGQYRIDYHDKQNDTLVQQTDKDISEMPWKFDIVEANLYMGQGLYIEDLDFDFANNVCSVRFFDANR